MTNDRSVGFIGLGRMGWHMAANLRKAGISVVGFDIDRVTASRFACEHDALAAEDPQDFGQVECLITMLPNGQAVADVLLGADGIAGVLPCLSADTLVIDMGSSNPADYEPIAPRLEELGLAMIDAPVSGGVAGAESGTLTVMAGGAEQDINRARPMFEIMGKTIFHAGEKVGSGQAVKALNNLVSAAGLMVTIEALLVAQRYGLDPVKVNRIINESTGRNNSTDRKIEPFVLSRAFDSGFALSLMAKDLRTAQAIAENTTGEFPLSRLVVEMAQQASVALEPDADHTAIARWIEGEVNETLTLSK